MLHFIDPRTPEQRKAAEAENKKPLSWAEYQNELRTAPPEKRRGLIDRLDIGTVPEELRGLLDACKHGKR